jgi:hypothetical protein
MHGRSVFTRVPHAVRAFPTCCCCGQPICKYSNGSLTSLDQRRDEFIDRFTQRSCGIGYIAPSLTGSESVFRGCHHDRMPSCTPISFTVTASASVSPLAHILSYAPARKLAREPYGVHWASEQHAAAPDCISADEGTVRGSTSVGTVIGVDSSNHRCNGLSHVHGLARTSRNQ